MKIIFIRHSKSLVNPEIPIATWALSVEGVELAKRLNNLEVIRSIEVIYSSLQPKALETAILATKDLGIPIRINDDLTESSSFTNKFVGISELEENTKMYHENANLSINNGETSSQALKRFNSAVEKIVEAESNRSVIGIVSHGGILADFAAQYARKSSFELVKAMRQPDIAEFDYGKKEFLTSFGDTTI